MQIARVCGTVVATLKHTALGGRKLLVVQPYDPGGRPRGRTTTAVDVVDAGVGDWVLLLDEGSSASQVLGTPRGPVRTVIVGVVDAVTPQARPPAALEPGSAPGTLARGAGGDAAIQDGTRG